MRMNTWKRWTALGAVGVMLLVGGLAIGASAASSRPSTGAAIRGPAGPGILAGAVHSAGTWTYAHGSTRSFVSDLGRITGLGPFRIRIRRADGTTVVAGWRAATCVRWDGRPATRAGLHLGMRALTISERTPSGGLHADVVRTGRPLVRRAASGCGLFARAVHGDSTVTYRGGSTRDLTWDRGAVDREGDSTIEFTRADGVRLAEDWNDRTFVVGGGPVRGIAEGTHAVFVAEPQDGGPAMALLIRPATAAS